MNNSPESTSSSWQRILSESLFAFVLAILISLGWLSYRDMTATITAEKKEIHTYVVLDELESLLSSLKDAESEQRGFLITGDDKYLEPYHASLVEVENQLAAVRRLTLDNPGQKQRLADITPKIAAKLAELDATIELRKTKGYQAASQAVLLHLEKNLMVEVSSLIADAKHAEEELLRARTARKEESTRNTIHSVLLGGTLGGLALLWVFISLQRELTHRYRAEAELRAHQGRLTEMVEARTKELRQEQAALRASQSLLQAVTDGSPNPIFMKDREGRMTMANPAALRAMGRQASEVIGKTDDEVYDDPSVGWAMMENDRQIMEKGLSVTAEEKVQTATGVRTFLSTRSPRLDPKGQIIGLIGVATDITERLQTEKALKESEERFRTMTNAMSQLAWIARPDGQIYWYNQRWYDYTGTTPELMKDRGWQSIHDPVQLPRVLERWNACITTGEPFEMTFPLRGADGLFRSFLTRVVPLKDAEGRVLQWLGTNTDVNELKEAQSEIERLNATLEERVRLRTAELVVANRELEAFSYSIAHDLRAPLRSIDGFSQAILQDYSTALDDEGKRYLEFVRTGCQQMGHLIDDLLKLSRVTRASMQHNPVSLTELAQRIASDLQRDAAGRVVHFKIADRLTSTGDSHLLEAALRNLIENAWKFTGKRPETVIEIGAMEEPSGTAASSAPVFFVRDNGVGFDMAYADKLFSPFQRLHSVADFPGTGIGLATVQRIIHRHGGRIWVEAAVDKGSTFYFTLNQKDNEA